MAVFRYRALSATGEAIDGEMEAASRDAVVARLQETRHFPVRVEALGEAGASPRAGRLSARDLGVFTRELATLVGAGLPLDRALEVVASSGASRRLAARAGNLLVRIRSGRSLATAMDEEGGAFSRLYVAMVRAGEASGSLDVVLQRLADYIDKARELRETVISALIYPAILVAVAGISLVLLLTQVVPTFAELFADAGTALPLPTRIVIGTGAWLADNGWLLLAVLAAAAVLAVSALRAPSARLAWDAFVLRLPLVGGLVRRVETARFARTLATLVGNGVVLIAAMGIVRDVVGNARMAAAIGELTQGLKEGQGLAGPLAAARILPDMAVHMVRVGEETGRLEAMLARVADAYDREVALALRRLLALLEPALILTLGVVIAGIIVSVLLAVLSVNDLAF
jgi:general secretion pathway protein F